MATFNAGAGGLDGSLFFELDRPEVSTRTLYEVWNLTTHFRTLVLD
jgi:hypothetical protein